MKPTAYFQRTTRDAPQRSTDYFAGPYKRRFFTLHKWVYGLTLAASILGTLAIFRECSSHDTRLLPRVGATTASASRAHAART